MTENVTIINHPLISHKVAVLRNRDTSVKDFRTTVKEIAALLFYEASKNLEATEADVVTPVGKTKAQMLVLEKMALVPILRAGLGMADGVLAVMPEIEVGHIGLERDHATLKPREYYFKMPSDIASRNVFIVDPMLATGGSAVAAVDALKRRGVKKIRFLCIVAAPEGIITLSKAHPDVEIYCAALDDGLNENGYIIPGLGDAGDRIFGTF